MTIKLDSSFDKTKATKNLVAKGYKLVPHIDRFLPTWDEEGFVYKSTKKESDDAWHPSGHCTPSVYDLWWYAVEGHKEERKLQPSSVKNFQVGHFWHQWLQWIIVEKLGFAESSAVERRGTRGWGDRLVMNNGHSSRWQPWHWVSGSGDLAPVTIPKKGEWLVDFKTMNARSYKLAVGGSLEERLAKSWECQINIYMDFFDLEKAIVVGICKDTPHDLIEFEFRKNQPLIDAIYEKWELVSGCLDENVEPPESHKHHLPLTGPV